MGAPADPYDFPSDVDPDLDRPTPLPYADFRVPGMTFATVAAELAAESRNAELRGDRMFWTRRTVLGRMREHKLREYEGYLQRWRDYQRSLEDLPF